MRNFQFSKINFQKRSAGFTPLEVLGRKISKIFRPHRDVSWHIIKSPCQEIASSKNRRLLTGFTLIEVVVAFAIIMAALIGPVALITRGLTDVTFARNRLVALNLAQ